MTQMLSPAQLLASLPEESQQKQLEALSPEEKANLLTNWDFWARPDQAEPTGDWLTWLILSGRGWGKTRTGAETVRDWMCGPTPLAKGKYSLVALVAETSADARKVMVEGESGLLAIHPPEFRPHYSPANRKLTWPNGGECHIYNATEPDQLRGPQHEAAWCDEIAKWQYMQETWDQLQMGLRLGDTPRTIVTSTPRPLPLVRQLVADPDTFVTRGRTYDNSDNLAKTFLKKIEERYAGTRLGRQEIDGEILNDVPGALWTRSSIDNYRQHETPEKLDRIIVAIDPAASSGEDADETGIVGAGVATDKDGHTRGYVLADRSIRGTPEEWAREAVALYRELEADRIVAEKNNGGEMVEAVIKAVDRDVPVTLVHASRGKHVRAEPISALYEQGRIHHVGMLPQLEDQMCVFTNDMDRANEGSPDRVDALVWALASLFDRMTARKKKQTNKSRDAEIAATKYVKESSPTGWMTG